MSLHDIALAHINGDAEAMKNTEVRTTGRVTRLQDLKKNFWVLLGCFLGCATSVIALVPYTIGATIPTLQATYGWDRATASSLVTFSGLAAGIAGIAAGFLIDKLGLRKVLGISIPAFAVVQLLLSATFAAGGAYTLVQFLFLLGGIVGAGTMTVAYTRAIVGTFTTARGLALGVMGFGSAATGMVLPPLVTTLLPTVGLSGMYLMYAVIVLLPLPSVFLSFRAASSAAAPAARTPLTVGRFAVLRTSVFWRLFVMFALLGGVATVLTTHIIPALVDRQVSPIVAAGVISMISVGSLAGRLVSGFLLDILPAKNITFVLFLLAVPSFPAVVWGPIGLVYGAALAAGVTIGSELDFLGYFLSRWVGVERLAFTMSLIFFGYTLVGAPAPYIAGLAYQANGNYDAVAVVVTAAVIISCILVVTLPRTTTVREDSAAPDSEEAAVAAAEGVTPGVSN